MKKISNILLFRTYRQIKSVLPESMKKVPEKLIFVAFVVSGLEFLGLASILPVINILVNEKIIEQNKYLNWAYEMSGFESTLVFTLLLMGIVLAIFLIKNIVTYFALRYQAKRAYQVAQQVAKYRFASYLSESYDFHIHQSTSLLVRNVRQIPYRFANGVMVPFTTLINDLFLAAFIIVGMLFYNLQLFLSILIFLIPMLLIYFKITRKQLKTVRNQLNMETFRLQHIAYQSFEAFKDITLFQRQSFFVKKFNSSLRIFTQASTFLRVLNSYTPRIFEVLVIAIIFGILLVGVLINTSTTALGQFLAVFAVAVYKLIPSASRVISFSNTIRATEFVFEHLKNLPQRLEHQEKPLSSPSQENLPFQKGVFMKNVSFSYPQSKEQILSGLDFSIPKGKTIGVMGPTGSGKTTLLNILLRLYEEDKGGIYVDDQKLTKQNRDNWYGMISYVPQDVIILNGTFLENIAFGVPEEDIDMERVNQAAEQAQIKSFIEQCSSGFHTLLGSKGLNISGGQRQRLAIARAIYKDAKVIFFDEATSDLDIKTEQMITESIRALSSEALTIFIIAHRIQTLKYCDKIYRLEKGKLSEPLQYSEVV